MLRQDRGVRNHLYARCASTIRPAVSVSAVKMPSERPSARGRRYASQIPEVADLTAGASTHRVEPTGAHPSASRTLRIIVPGAKGFSRSSIWPSATPRRMSSFSA